ncbi:MAG: hypothetical protein H6551_04295 [Chitinophagales bacterium]|nr:hypothetical protein [Chitinophagaceae bacterium]MCB9064344.1 hypothetical protein [Chitinophagales bacterium]
MNFNRIILVFALLFAMSPTYAQKHKADKPHNVELNKLDNKGKRHGLWMNSEPERMGEPSYTEFGNYEHGDKMGAWYKMDYAYDLVSIENYKFDVLDGEVKYFVKGQLVCLGQYRGLNPDREVDTIMVEDPVSGRQELVAVKSSRGTVRHGLWRYYDEQSGQLKRIEEYQVDDLIYHKDIYITKADSIRNAERINQTMNAREKDYYRPPASKQVHYTR